MSRAVLWVAPELLSNFAALLPRTVRVVGSVDSGPDHSVGLLVESEFIPAGCSRVRAMVSVDGASQTIRIEPA